MQSILRNSLTLKTCTFLLKLSFPYGFRKKHLYLKKKTTEAKIRLFKLQAESLYHHCKYTLPSQRYPSHLKVSGKQVQASSSSYCHPGHHLPPRTKKRRNRKVFLFKTGLQSLESIDQTLLNTIKSFALWFLLERLFQPQSTSF